MTELESDLDIMRDVYMTRSQLDAWGRIAAALNREAQLVEALRELLDQEPEHCACGDDGCSLHRRPWDAARKALAAAGVE